jgi:hypothetical protein
MQGVSGKTMIRARLAAVGTLLAATGAVAAAGALAAASKPIVLADPREDVSGPLDLRHVSLRRATDGRLRAAMTFVSGVTPQSLLAESGPPGSACLRIWTSMGADPASTRPDRLVCLTARADGELRGGVYEVEGSALPTRVADASVARSRNGRGFVIRFTQSSLGRPQRLRFALESTGPGCERPNCIDSVPDGERVRVFRLR